MTPEDAARALIVKWDAVEGQRFFIGGDVESFVEAIAAALAARAREATSALDNCFMLARRMLHRSKPVDPEWSHIARFCKEAGCKEGGVLRDEQAGKGTAHE